jgi:hypothetical protein
MQSTFPCHVHSNAHDWRQLLILQGKICSLRRAFTNCGFPLGDGWFYGVDDDRSIYKLSLAVSLVEAPGAPDQPLLWAPVAIIKIAIFIEEFQQMHRESGVLEQAPQASIIEQNLVVFAVRTGSIWFDPFNVIRVRMVTVRDGDSEVSAGLQKVMAVSGGLDSILPIEVLPHVLGHQGIDRVEPKVGRPMPKIERIEHFTLCWGPTFLTEAAGADHNPTGGVTGCSPQPVAPVGALAKPMDYFGSKVFFD